MSGFRMWQRHRLWVSMGIAVSIGAVVLAAMVGAFANRPGTAGATSPSITTNSCGVGNQPDQPAWDPSNHYLYVPNQVSDNVTVVTPNCKTVTSIALPTGADATSAVFDPANNWVYVTDTSLNCIYALSGTSLKKNITSSLLDAPINPTYDPAIGGLVVPDYYASNVSIVQGSHVVENLPVGIEPRAASFDPSTDTILIANTWTNNVTILGADLTHLADVPVGADPWSIAYDAADQLDYVANGNGYNLTVINGYGAQITSISLGTYPTTVVFDQKNLDIYVSCSQARYLQVIHGTSLIRTEIFVLPYADPWGVTFVDYTNMVYVTDPVYNLLYIMP